ncbi:hypothetical protein L6164_007183 [Bauhinia variegata]|uniref:Uncharacterized protein n=1 Tax=Bauhinia variegata TaxID=167791 RepID=A0ACB9PYU1_BAUVA|nr:hypothetical protein L6164_007183 [Bauhinia variegata]
MALNEGRYLSFGFSQDKGRTGMELEVGLKISKTRDDITSISEFRVAKDRVEPVFLSRETDSMFILTAHLTGYKRENIDIKINEDGSEISISGEKPVQEKLMLGWIMLKKEVEIKGFRKVFKIPHGVILDRIKAKYNQEESVFKIVMPKLVKGISGVRIEEVKEEGGTGRGRLELKQSEAEAEAEAGHTSNSFGETSKQVSKESGIQKTEEIQSVGEKIHGEATGETIQKKIETKHRGGESVREKVISEGFRDMKKSALDQNVADNVTKKNGQTSQEVTKLSSEIQEKEETENAIEKMEGRESEKMLAEGGNGVIKGDLTWGKQETGEEGMKVTELDQSVAYHIPSNIDETNKEAISEKTVESERTLVEANAVIAENKEPQIESVDKSKEHRREVGMGGFEATKTSMEEFPQLVPETPLEGNVGPKMEETKHVKKAVIKRKGKEIECLEEKIGGKESKKMYVKPNMVIEKDVTEETTRKGSEEQKIEHKHDDQQIVPENIVKGEFEAFSGVTQDFAKQVEQMSLDGSKRFKVTKMEETEEVREAMARKNIKEIECFTDKVEGDLESKSMHKEANEEIEKNTLKEAFEKEIEDSKIKTNGNQQNLQENIVKGAFELLGTVIEEFPKQVEEAMAKKGRKEIEDSVSKVKEEGSTKMLVEGNGDFEKDMVEETSQKESREPRIGTRDSDQLSGQEKVDKGGFDVMETLRNMFPKQSAEILLEGGKGSKDTKGEETKGVKEESTKTKSPVEKVKGEEIEKIHVKANEDFREDVIKETILKEIQEAKVETMDRGQQCGQKDISKGTFEARETATEEFSKQMAESSLIEESEGSKVARLEETKKVKEVGKSGEIEIVPEKCTPEREVRHTNIAPHPKVVIKGFKEVERGNSKDKPELKELLPQEIQSKSTRVSEQQDILKVKRAKEVEEGEQYSHSMDGTKTVGSIADQVVKPFQVPSLPSTQKSQVEEIEVPKIENDNIAQQSARKELDHKGEIGRKDITGKELQLPKQDYIANAKDEKPRKREEIQKLDSEEVDDSKVVEETMQTRPEIEHQRKSEAAATHPEVISTEFEVVDQKNGIEEPPGKELSPPRVQVQSKESFEPEKSSMKLNFPRTTRLLPEMEERKGYGHVKEGIKTPEIVEYQAAKGSDMQNIASSQQSIVEAKHEASIESPKQKSEIFFQESNKGRAHSADKEMDTLQRLEEKQKVDVTEEAHLAYKFPEKIQGRTKGTKMFAEDKCQQLVRENIDKKTFETNVAEEELLKRGRGAETLLEKSEVPKMGETELVSQQSLRRERAKTSKTAQDKKGEVKKISEMTQEKSVKEHLRESAGATLEIGEKPSKATATRPKATTEEFEDLKPINQSGKSQTEELSYPTMEVQSRMPHESAKKQKILEREGVQQEMERRKPMHVLAGNEVPEAEIPKREVEPPEATVTRSKATNIKFKKVEPKGESDKEGTNELTSPFVEKLREEPYELAKPTMKQDTPKAEILQQVHKEKEIIQSPQGSEASKARADKVDEPSMLPSPSSTQQFEVKGKGKTEEYCEDSHLQESEKQESEMKADQDVEQTETSKPDFPTDQQSIKDDQQVIGEEESHERHEIEEKTANERGDEASQDNLQESVEQKDPKEETSGEKKYDKRSSNKFRATLMVAGSAILISLTVFFIRHKRAKKR